MTRKFNFMFERLEIFENIYWEKRLKAFSLHIIYVSITKTRFSSTIYHLITEHKSKRIIALEIQ